MLPTPRGRPRRSSAACSSRSPRSSRPRTRRRSASSSARRRSATTAGSPRASSSRSRTPRSRSARRSRRSTRSWQRRPGSKKGAVTKHVNRIVDGLLDKKAPRSARRTPRSSPGVDMKNLEKARDLGKGLLQGDRREDAGDANDEAIRELVGDLCLKTDGKIAKEDHDAIVQWLHEGPRDVHGHRVAAERRPRGGGRGRPPARDHLAAVQGPRAEDGRQRRADLP